MAYQSRIVSPPNMIGGITVDDVPGLWGQTKDLLEDAGVDVPSWASPGTYFPTDPAVPAPEDTEMPDVVVVPVQEPSFIKKHSTLLLIGAAIGGYMVLRGK